MLRKSAKEALDNIEDLPAGLKKEKETDKGAFGKKWLGWLTISKQRRMLKSFLTSAKKLEKIKPEEALKYLDDALEHFNHEVIDNVVVQISNTNCINVVQKVDKFLETGTISKASSSGYKSISELEDIYGKTFLTYKISSLENVMKNGERGIIYGDRGVDEIGHVFNVFKTKGELKFVDGQIGKAASLQDGYILFKNN